MLGEIFRGNRRAILLTYTVLLAENLVFALFPYYLGRSIDSLLEGRYGWFAFYVSVCLVGIVVGVSRRMFDTRVFAGVWRRVATKTIHKLMDGGVDPAKVITRAGLSTRFVDFFEFHLPHLLQGCVAIATATVMLAIAVPSVICWVMLLAACALGCAYHVSVRCKTQDVAAQESIDQSNDAINKGDRQCVADAYEQRTACYIRSSDWQAWGWGATDALGVVAEVMVVLTLVRFVRAPGEIVSTVTYTWTLFGSIGGLAEFFTRWKEVEVAKEKIAEETPSECEKPAPDSI